MGAKKEEETQVTFHNLLRAGQEMFPFILISISFVKCLMQLLFVKYFLKT